MYVPEVGKPLPDEASIGEALAYYDSFLALKQRSELIPGVQAAVFANDAIVLSTAHGLADAEGEISLTDEHLFRIASISKSFTAVAVMRLVDAGVLRLDDPVSRWVEYLAESPIGAVTIRELLSHTGGLTGNGEDADFFQLGIPYPDEDGLREIALAESAAALPRRFAFKYSNAGFSLVGLAAANAVGLSFDELIQREIADRLGLANTGADLDPARLADYATGYVKNPLGDGHTPVDHAQLLAYSPAGGLFSTARDLCTFFSALFLGDERLVSDYAKREMQESPWDTGWGRYGLGLVVIDVGDRTLIGHSGGIPGFATRSLADPHGKLVVSVVTNSGPAETLAVAAVKLIDLAGSKPRPEVTDDLGRFTGRFANVMGVMDIAILGGRLYGLTPTMEDPSLFATPLEIVDDRTLRSVGGPTPGELVPVTFADDGRIASIRGTGDKITYLPIEDFRMPDRITLRPSTSPGRS
jgi:CubicO group peptidase (beta-lactamase class C family)